MNSGQVFRIEIDPAALTQSGVGFRRHTTIDLHRVGEEVAAHLHRRIDESVAGTQQHDNHEDAPRHSETRERRAELVPPCRLPYFSDYISHSLFHYAATAEG